MIQDLRTQCDKIYQFIETKLPKLNFKNSLILFLAVNSFLAINSLFAFLPFSLIFGFTAYQNWQNLEAINQKMEQFEPKTESKSESKIERVENKTQLKYNSLLFKIVEFLYLLPFFLGILLLVLLPFIAISYSFNLFSNQFSFGIFGIIGLSLFIGIFPIISGLFSIGISGIIGLSLFIYWQKLEQMILEFNRNLQSGNSEKILNVEIVKNEKTTEIKNEK